MLQGPRVGNWRMSVTRKTKAWGMIAGKETAVRQEPGKDGQIKTALIAQK